MRLKDIEVGKDYECSSWRMRGPVTVLEVDAELDSYYGQSGDRGGVKVTRADGSTYVTVVLPRQIQEIGYSEKREAKRREQKKSREETIKTQVEKLSRSIGPLDHGVRHQPKGVWLELSDEQLEVLSSLLDDGVAPESSALSDLLDV